MHAIAAVITFQFAYTTVFGWFAAHLFLRYHSFWVVVAVHSLCNAMGFPEFSDMAEHPRAKGRLTRMRMRCMY